MRPLVIVAIVTPLVRGAILDVNALSGHVEELVERGVDGFFLCGTTGEGALLDDGEVVLATRTVERACRGRAVVTAHVGRPSTPATVRLLRLALDAGATAVAAVTPYFYELDDARLEAHYETLIASANGRPVYAYTIPRRAGNDLGPELVARLARRGLTGIKDSTRLLARHAEYLDVAVSSPRFEVYMGTDSYALEALGRGSTGVVSAVANVRPDLFISLRSAVEEGRTEEALGLQEAIDEVRDSLRSGEPIANLKAAVAGLMTARGVAYPADARPPLGAPVP